MAKFPKILKIRISDEREIVKILKRMENNKTPIRVEIENENIHFFTILSIKRNLVVVAKPMGLKVGLKRDGFVRFKVPDEENKDIRMSITVPHFNLLSGSFVFLCNIPKSFAETSSRGAERFNTSRFNNLHLMVPSKRLRFRIIDMSSEGLKIFANQLSGKTVFPPGQQIANASITVGGKVKIELAALIPRSFNGKTVGLQIQVSKEGSAKKYLSHFIKSLEDAENNSFQVDG